MQLPVLVQQVKNGVLTVLKRGYYFSLKLLWQMLPYREKKILFFLDGDFCRIPINDRSGICCGKLPVSAGLHEGTQEKDAINSIENKTCDFFMLTRGKSVEIQVAATTAGLEYLKKGADTGTA